MASKCYWIDGSPAPDDRAPCNPEAEFSPCCALKKENPDICLTSGLCYAQQVGGYEGFIFSNGCTDATGRASQCPHICPDRANDWNGGSIVTGYNVLQCNFGVYCCRELNSTENCCANKSALVTTRIGILHLPTATTTTTMTMGASETALTATTSHVATSPNCPTGNPAIVGGAVGGSLGAALLASFAAFAILYRRRLKEHKSLKAAYKIATTNNIYPELGGTAVYELQEK